MKKLVQVLALALMAAACFGQVREVIATDGRTTASIGRNRQIVETDPAAPGSNSGIGTVRSHNWLYRLFHPHKLDIKWEDASPAVHSIAKHNRVEIVARHPKPGCTVTEECGEIFYSSTSYNLVVNAGLNWLADIMSSTSTPSVNAQCNYIALTNTGITPGATDTTLSGEISSNGLSRAQATYAHTSNATTYTLAKTFTATGAQSAQAGAVFTASSAGTMCFEDTFTSATLATNDTLTVTWTITI